MINGLGVLGWGVGGIEAEAAMLGQPIAMLIPEVVGFKLTGRCREGATATDLVLTVTEMLRGKGVVGQVRRVLRPRRSTTVAGRPRHHRQHGARVRRDHGIFPVDAETLRYLRLSGRTSGSSWSRPTPRRRACGATRHARPGVHRHARARPGHRRAVDRRPSARRTGCR